MYVIYYPELQKYLANGRRGATTTDLQRARTFTQRNHTTVAATAAEYYVDSANGLGFDPFGWQILEAEISLKTPSNASP